jgi:hypothetical protein
MQALAVAMATRAAAVASPLDCHKQSSEAEAAKQSHSAIQRNLHFLISPSLRRSILQ